MTPKSFKLVYKHPLIEQVALDGFSTAEDAERYNKEFYVKAGGLYNINCYVAPDFNQEPYRDIFGNYL